MTFAQKLKALRTQAGMTQEQLAEAIYVTRAAISKWETGRGYPGVDSLKLIAQTFGVSIDELISEDDVQAKRMLDAKKSKCSTVRRSPCCWAPLYLPRSFTRSVSRCGT